MMTAHLLAVATWALVAGLDRAGVSARRISMLARGWLVAAVLVCAAPSLAPETWAPVAAASWAPDISRIVVDRVGSSAMATAAAPVWDVPWLALGAMVGTARLGLGVWALGRQLRGSVALRRYRGVEVRVAPGIGAAAALWTPLRSFVLLDPRTAADPVDGPIAIRHEATHHRHGDAAWAWAWALAGALLWPNPFVGALVRRVRSVEEVACDEAVVRRVQPRLYADSLLRAAALARPLPHAPLAAFPTDLHRRLTVLTTPPRRSVPLIPAFLLGMCALLGTVAVAGPAPSGESAALHDITSSAKGRAFYRQGIANRAQWSDLVDGALADAGMPAWLAAVPLVESGYTNLGAPDDAKYGPGGSRAPGMPGRGLWMFIPATARTYGLQVDDTVDQRFDPVLETAAAIELLTDLHAEFGDWDLALAAYNEGPTVVRAAIESGGTRDALALHRAGLLNRYVAEVHAAAAILARPELVD